MAVWDEVAGCGWTAIQCGLSTCTPTQDYSQSFAGVHCDDDSEYIRIFDFHGQWSRVGGRAGQSRKWYPSELSE